MLRSLSFDEGLGLFRAIGGLALVLYYLSSYSLLTWSFGEWGLQDALTAVWGSSDTSTAQLQGLLSAFTFHVLYVFAVLSAIGMMLGFRTRATSVLAFACAGLRVPHAGGVDGLVTWMTALLMIYSVPGYTARRYSLDAQAEAQVAESVEISPQVSDEEAKEPWLLLVEQNTLRIACQIGFPASFVLSWLGMAWLPKQMLTFPEAAVGVLQLTGMAVVALLPLVAGVLVGRQTNRASASRQGAYAGALT